jgi:hypothetical protein
LQFSQRQAEAQHDYDDAARRGDQVAQDIARQKLDRIQELKALAQQEAALQNQSPLEKLRDELSRTSAQINEDLEGVAVNGLKSLEDGLVDTIMHAKNLGDVFKGVANQIIADLVRIAVEQAVIKPLAGLLGGGGGGGPLGSIIGGLFADGGRPPVGKVSIVGERGPELFIPDQPGTIVPNRALSVPRAALSAHPSAPQQVTVIVQANDYFDARVADVSSQVSAHVVQRASGPIVSAAVQQANRVVPATMAKRQRYG